MSETPRLKLPAILAAQAQKHITHNEALYDLDALVQLSCLSRTIAATPATPAEGDTYLVPAGATGGWAGQDGAIAAFAAGAWRYATPLAGFRAWVADEDALLVHDGAAWTVLLGPGAALDDLASLGVNATADLTNRLSVRSDAVLFDAIPAAASGSGDSQLKINKETAADTASQLFQTGYSGRAEFGLTGDDDFHVKVSPDGSGWSDALVVDRNSGAVAFAAPPRVPAFAVAGLPSAAAIAGALVFVTDEAGGAVVAFSDGTDWRRVTDRAVVS